MTPLDPAPGDPGSPRLSGWRVRDKGGSFFLYGEDAFRREEAVQALVDWHLDPSTRDFNFDVVKGSEVDGEALASLLATPPLMAEWRVVLVREVEALASRPDLRDLLLRVVRKPFAGLALILVAAISADPREWKAQFYRQLREHARSFPFPAVDPQDLPDWLVAWVRDRWGREMTAEAARALAAGAGPDPGVLAQEVAKLVNLVPEGETVDLEAVRKAGTRIPAADRWGWLDRVAEKDFRRALGELDVLLAQGETGVGLVAALATHFLRLGLALTAGTAGLKEALPPHQQFLAARIAGQARKWGGEELEEALLGLRRADRLLKSGSLPAEVVLAEWLLGLGVRTPGGGG